MPKIGPTQGPRRSEQLPRRGPRDAAARASLDRRRGPGNRPLALGRGPGPVRRARSRGRRGGRWREPDARDRGTRCATMGRSTRSWSRRFRRGSRSGSMSTFPVGRKVVRAQGHARGRGAGETDVRTPRLLAPMCRHVAESLGVRDW